jgi:hypothetical protein
MRKRGIGLAIGLWACGTPATPPPARPAPTPVATAAHRLKRKAHADGIAAYERKDFAACGRLLAEAEDFYNAACCYARAGELDAAFAQLGRAADRGHRADFTTDDDLAAMRGDPRWPGLLARQAEVRAKLDRTRNAELAEIYRADQADRALPYDHIEWSQVEPRDAARRARVDAIVAAGQARTADDYYHAAMVYQHGATVPEIQRARDLALRAVALDPDHQDARWLAAAAEDRVLVYQYQAQKWGTQFKRVDGKWIVWPVDPAITDDERDAWNVPTLAEARASAEAMNAKAAAAAAAKAASADAKPAAQAPSADAKATKVDAKTDAKATKVDAKPDDAKADAKAAKVDAK